MENTELHPSQNLGRSRGSRPYRRKRASRHSYSSNSIPFTIDGCTVSRAPVFVTCVKRYATWTGAPVRVSASAFSKGLTFRFRTYPLPSHRNAAWYAVLNYSLPLIAATICPVMTQDVVQFSGDVSSVYGKARPYCFTSRRVNPHLGITSPTPWKMSVMNESCSVFLTVPKTSLMLGVIHYMNSHSCWSKFCSPV